MTEDELIPAKALLKGFAKRVSTQAKIQVVLTPQTDSDYTWQGELIHPLQPLENMHQRASREAVWRELDPEKHQAASGEALSQYFGFSVGTPKPIPTPDNTKFEDKLREARGKIAKAWVEVREVKQGGYKDSDKFPTITKGLADALDLLSEIVQEFTNISLEFNVTDEDLPIIPQSAKLLNDSKTKLNECSPSSLAITSSSSQVNQNQDDWALLYDILSKQIRPAFSMISSMITGLSCIQIFQVIDTFYLYRLLVKFRIESDQEIDEGKKRQVSGDLTDILNNEQTWVRDWLKVKMVDLNKFFEQTGDVGFHLKGGRALYYVMRQPELGKNDWDTSVLINPALHSQQWYEKLSEVHNVILERLQRYKREFFVLAHKKENIENMKHSLQTDASEQSNPQDKFAIEDINMLRQVELIEQQAEHNNTMVPSHMEPDSIPEVIHPKGSILFPKYRAGTKAEMIDIGIPRRDTPQSQGHWHEIIIPGVLTKAWTDDIPVPAHRYYIDEYLMMVRSAFDTPQKKVEKRATRLAAMLRIGPQDNDPEKNMNLTVRQAYDRAHGNGIDGALSSVKSLPLAEKRLLTVLLEEFCDAYGLAWKSGLAAAFDHKFQQLLSDKSYVDYSPSIQDCLSKLGATDDHIVVQQIGFAHKLAHDFEKHFKSLASYFGFSHSQDETSMLTQTAPSVPALTQQKDSQIAETAFSKKMEPKDRRNFLCSIVRVLFGASILTSETGKHPVFSPSEELQIQFAVTGSFAAHLHADYGANLHDDKGVRRVPDALRNHLKNDLDPVNVIEIKVYCDPNMKLEEEAKNRGETIEGNVYEMIMKPALDTFIEKVNIPSLKFTRIDNGDIVLNWPENISLDGLSYQPTVIRLRIVTKGWPQLSYIWGYPVLTLPDLIREYNHLASETIEYTAEQRLARTSKLLSALLTYFEGFEEPGNQLSGNKKSHRSGDDNDAPKDYPKLYSIMLGTAKNATNDIMRSRYRKKFLLHHPDHAREHADIDYINGLTLIRNNIKAPPTSDSKDVALCILGFTINDTPSDTELLNAYKAKRKHHEMGKDFDAPAAIDYAYKELGGQQTNNYDELKASAKNQWLHVVRPMFFETYPAADLPAELNIDDRDSFDGDGGPGVVRIFRKIVTESDPSILLYALCHETSHAVVADKVRSLNKQVPAPMNDGARQHEYLADLIGIDLIQTRLPTALGRLTMAMNDIEIKLGTGDVMHPSGQQRVAKMRRLLNGHNTLDELIVDILDHPPHGNL